MCKIIVCSGRSLILGGKNVQPSFAYSSCSTHIVLYHIYDIDYVYRIYYMMHAAVYLVVQRSQPPHAHPCPLYLGRLHSTHPVPVWAKRAVCHKVSSAQPAERHESCLSHIPHPCYLLPLPLPKNRSRDKTCMTSLTRRGPLRLTKHGRFMCTRHELHKWEYQIPPDGIQEMSLLPGSLRV